MNNLRPRIIPTLLMENNRLVKTVKFKNPNYIGDPINAVKIFNDKEVDELIFLDIGCSKKHTSINYNLLDKIASQSFMPLCYGGGIKTFEEASKIFELGFEKISLNSVLFEKPSLLTELSQSYGSQSIVASVDVKKNLFGKLKVYNGSKNNSINDKILDYVKNLENLGAGELLINSVDLEGTYKGYNLSLINELSNALTIPLIALGGASSTKDFKDALQAGASACAAGSLFVYYGVNKAVLINYPTDFINEL
ncbi:AglZ/HisF2 family acetamidino modification protein [Methanococcus voltae]|uniref:Imidazole glycerol phosphate synthase subunit HisF n=1 Tax=Methanococcus voltae (strain ATCC BAA-1334 / A3) TaxID=456320 RepID=D7DRY6_METV3|nr:AglZ/HisF2 family acetamidino modification protein [Methanococcus voltae]MCS3901421.1 cyclase [Methanococcus voltae]